MTAAEDFATPNLPSRNFDATESFYHALGFETDYRSSGWMILKRGGVMLEFVPFADLDPASSAASCCLRLTDLDRFAATCVAAGIPVTGTGWPRLHLPRLDVSGERIGYLIDADGSLLRLIDENRTE